MTILLVGKQFGDYRLIRLIGCGGFADVYLGEHCRRKTLAAVKVLNTRLANDNVKSFLNEARSIRLRHPNIVQILDFGLEDDFPFLVMEYAPNGSIRQLYPKGTQLKLGTICMYVHQIAGALHYAHNEGVVHRDIKPDNMLLGRKKELLLSDFGIASIAHSTHSMSGEDQAGTINYMAPEQLQGKPRPASDQYALGIVAYEWICGIRPFQGSFVEIHGQHLSTPPPSLRKRVPTLSIAVEKVVMTALAKDPHRRFPTISAFARAFEQACKPVSTDRQINRRVFTTQSPLSKVFADVPANIPQKNAEIKPIEERPTTPKEGFRPYEIRSSLTPAKNVEHVPVKARVSLPEVGSKTHDKKNLFHSGDVKVLVSIIHKRIRAWPFAFLIMTVSMLIAGLVLALPGGRGFFSGIFYRPLNMSSVTITPKSVDLANTYEIFAITGTPNSNSQEIAEQLLTATSTTQSKTVTSTGTSIPATRATGSLTFFNSGNFAQTFGGVILRGHSGVSVTFNGPITVPAALPSSITVNGFAVNVGSAGNIGALDISGPCCASGVTVKNGAFSGGQDPQPGSTIQQSDINGAASALVASLTLGTQVALKKQVQSNEQVVPNTLRCTSAVSANHVAGDQAPNVTVIVMVTCKEEIYDQQAAQTLGASLQAKQASTDLGPNYALTGNIVAEVTRETVVDTKGTLVILVRAESVWVYQFSNIVLQGFAKHIAKATNQDAVNYIMSRLGVKAVKIDNPSGNTLPDAAHITIEIVAIPGAPGAPTVMPGSPGVVHNRVVTPTATPTQGLGGS